MILTGNIMLYYDQFEAPGNAIIPPSAPPTPGDARFEAFKKMAQAAKAHGSLCVGQVSHPGRQTASVLQKDPVSASDVQLEGVVMGFTFAKPHAASEMEIRDIVEAFAHSAEYLHRAGYDGIQLHGAHGYLLAQFLSQTTNRRGDKYGGSLENRARIVTEIAGAVRARVPREFMLGIKLNSVEFQDKGFSPEEAKEMCTILSRERFDFVELSGGTYESLAFQHKRESSKKRENFFLDFADSIAPALHGTGTRTYVTGGLKTVGAMVDSLKTVDGVGLGRPICQEPRICRDILEGRITGVIQQQFDESNFGLTNVVAGSQIRQIGKDQEPLDGSDPRNKQAFEKDMGAWMNAKAHDEKGEMFGFVDIESLPPVPYVTASAA